MEFFIIIILLGMVAPILGPLLGLLIAGVGAFADLIKSGYRYSNGIPEPEKKVRAVESWGFSETDDDIDILDDIFDDIFDDDDDHSGSFYGDICDGTFENSYWD